MKVRHPVATNLKPLAQGPPETLVRHHVEERRARRPEQAPRPSRDDERPDDAHERVEERPSKDPAGEQRHDGEHRGEGIRDDVQVGRAEVGVVRAVVGRGRMPVIVMPIMGVIVIVMIIVDGMGSMAVPITMAMLVK